MGNPKTVPQGVRSIALCHLALIFFLVIAPISHAQNQQQANAAGAEPKPQPAVSAILAAFDKYEVVGMPEAHGLKDLDDFILMLIRNPLFPEKVNDIEVECGNALYQPILDRYIVGEDVPFTEVRKVWRNTTQVMCSASGFFEELFPLVRAINQKLPAGKRLRVLAGDPPIDWDQVKTVDDTSKFFDRDASIASVLEKEVLSKHRKALMLFGTFHLFHGIYFAGSGPRSGPGSAVSIYEKNYPNLTFVISDFGFFDLKSSAPSSNQFADWPVPSLTLAKGTWLGALDLSHFLPPPLIIEDNCNTRNEFPKEVQKPMEELVDAFLYLGPTDLILREQMPADIALDTDYMAESERRLPLQGFPPESFTSKEFNERMVRTAQNAIFTVPRPPDARILVQRCLDRKSRRTPQ
jgi:hypothetical protein